MRRLTLHRRDGSVAGYALVDEEDYERFAHLPWSLATEGYAVNRRGSLHRLIMDAAPGVEVDHRSRNRLDCRRSNLRLATRALNAQNLPSYRGSTSRYRGVSFDSKTRNTTKKWIAQVKVNGRRILYRRFATETEAAQAAARVREETMPYAG